MLFIVLHSYNLLLLIINYFYDYIFLKYGYGKIRQHNINMMKEITTIDSIVTPKSPSLLRNNPLHLFFSECMKKFLPIHRQRFFKSKST